MRLTPEGEVLYQHVAQACEQIAIGEKKIQAMLHLDWGSIHIGSSDMIMHAFLLPYLERFHKDYPKVRISTITASTPETIASLRARRIDLGVVFSPVEENEDLAYVIPKEGSNLWMDNFAIVKGAKNKENAEKFLNFLCRPEIMKMNFEYITYSVPSSKARELLPDEYKNSTIAFPALDSLKNCEVLKYVGKDGDSLYNQKWKEIMSE